MFLYSLIGMSIGPMLPAISEMLQVHAAELGLIFTVYFAGNVFAVIGYGYYGELIHNRFRLLIGGCLLMGASALALWWANSLTSLYIVFFPMGFGVGTLQTTATALCAHLNHTRQEYSLNVLHIFFSFGAVLAPIGCALLLYYRQDWRWMFTFVAIGVVIMVAFLLSAKEKEREFKPILKLADVGLLFHSKQFIWSCFAVLVYVGIEAAVWGWLAEIVHVKANLGRALSAATLSLFWLTVTLGRVVVSAIVWRVGAASVTLVLTIASVFTIAMLGFVNSSWQVWASVALIGFSFSGVFAGVFSMGTIAAGKHLSAATSLLIVCAGVGGMIVPALTGYVSQIWSFTTSIGLLAVLQVVLVGILLKLRKIYTFQQQ